MVNRKFVFGSLQFVFGDFGRKFLKKGRKKSAAKFITADSNLLNYVDNAQVYFFRLYTNIDFRSSLL